jgi:hypothetical protein
VVEVRAMAQEACDAAKEGDVMVDVLDPRMVIEIQVMHSKRGWTQDSWQG